MDEEQIKEILQVAENAVEKAGKYLSEQPHRHVISEKSSNDSVLDADVESERIIIDTIEASFPDHGILSEERGLLRENSPYRWIIDPLDGSFNYEHGDMIYGVMVGFVAHNEPVIAVIALPASNVVLISQKQKGTAKNGEKSKVSAIEELRKARIHFGDFTKTDDGAANFDRIGDLKHLIDNRPVVK